MHSFCYEQSIDEVTNCSKPQTHMVCHIYSLGTAMACGEFSNILLLTDCTHLALTSKTFLDCCLTFC